MEGKSNHINSKNEKYEEDQTDNLESGYSNTIQTTTTKKTPSILGEEYKESQKPERLTIKILIDY